jgi:3-oxoadipate enol-lactonase
VTAGAHGGHPPLLHYTVDGREGAPWLVFSNSLATDLTLWDEQVGALADDWRILRYDLRGHGGSPHSPIARHDLQVLAGDLLSVMDAAGAERAVHVGVSIGALAGLAAARAAPRRFTALVCCNARCKSTPQAAADLAGRADLALREGMTALVAQTLEKWFGIARLPLRDDRRAKIAAMIAATGAADFAAYALGMQSYDLDEAVGEMPLPMLLLAGRDEGTIPSHFEALSKRYPALAFVKIDGAGHLPNVHAPAAFNEQLTTFLARYAQPGGGAVSR